MIESIRANFRKDARIRTSIDVNELIGEALALVRDDLQRHRILIKAESNARLPRIMGDRIQLQQVLLNLITNAVDAMEAKMDLEFFAWVPSFATTAVSCIGCR